MSPFSMLDQVRKTSVFVPSLRWIKTGKPLRPSRLRGGSSPESLCVRPVSAVDQLRKTSAPVPSLRWTKSGKPLPPDPVDPWQRIRRTALTRSTSSLRSLTPQGSALRVVRIRTSSSWRVFFGQRGHPEERENCALASPGKGAKRSGGACASNSPLLNPDQPIAKVVWTSCPTSSLPNGRTTQWSSSTFTDSGHLPVRGVRPDRARSALAHASRRDVEAGTTSTVQATVRPAFPIRPGVSSLPGYPTTAQRHLRCPAPAVSHRG
jgi:hypothetical protein